MEVLGSGPEGRTCSAFDCSTGRKNIACPCFDRACEMNEENSRSFPFRDLAVSIGSQYLQPLTALAAGSFVFFLFFFSKFGVPSIGKSGFRF